MKETAMKDAIEITRAGTGFIIYGPGGGAGMHGEPLAGLTTPLDLARFVSQWAGLDPDDWPSPLEVSGRAVDEPAMSPEQEAHVRRIAQQTLAEWQPDTAPADDGEPDPADDPLAIVAAGPEQAPPEPQPDPAVDAPEDDDAPEAATSAPAGAALAEGRPSLTKTQERVLDHLALCAVAAGNERVQISYKALADKSGVAQSSINYLLGELERKGLIVWEKQGRGYDPFFTVAGALVDADGD